MPAWPVPVTWSRAWARQMRPDTCTLYRYGTPTRDTMGGEVPTSPTMVANVPCQYQPYQGTERVGPSDQQIRQTMVVIFHLAHDQAIDANDQIDYNGRRYSVVWLPEVGQRDAERLVGVRLNI